MEMLKWRKHKKCGVFSSLCGRWPSCVCGTNKLHKSYSAEWAGEQQKHVPWKKEQMPSMHRFHLEKSGRGLEGCLMPLPFNVDCVVKSTCVLSKHLRNYNGERKCSASHRKTTPFDLLGFDLECVKVEKSIKQGEGATLIWVKNREKANLSLPDRAIWNASLPFSWNELKGLL